MADSVLTGAVDFIARLGVYDVILPFILVFVLIFAFLEKTKVLGLEKVNIDGKDHLFPRRNLNSLLAFTIAFFVIASSQLVRIISEVLANVVLVVLLGFSFMLSVGLFHKGDKEFELEKTWRDRFYYIAFVAILLIFFNALGWLEIIYSVIIKSQNSSYMAALLMVISFAGLIMWLTGSPKPTSTSSDNSSEKGDGN